MENQPELFPQERTDALNQLLSLNRRALDLEEEIKESEEQLKITKDALNHIQTVLMPALMEELEITEFTLNDGRKIKLNEITTGSLSEATRPAAFQWLRQNGHDGIIKNQVIASIPRGMDEIVTPLLRSITDMGINEVINKEDVHYQTLQAFLREMAHTDGFPRELFKVHEYKKVVVK